MSRCRGPAPWRRVALGIWVTLALSGTCAASAGADVFGTTSLLSASPFLQFEYAHDPAISANGRFLVFDGSIHGVTGVWRQELSVDSKGEVEGTRLEQVAGGEAELPSISQEGRYVSFTSNEGALLPSLTDEQPHLRNQELEESPGVYVRDMEKRPEQEDAFTLASAANGSTTSLQYEYAAGETGEHERREYGSTAAGRTALSADGREVAFVTTAPSNLAGPGTPALQVAVRNLETDETKLVSAEYDPSTGGPSIDPATGQPEPVPEEEEGSDYGAVYSQGGQRPKFGRLEPYELPQLAGASISADGSTVAWLGQDIAEQVPTLPAETLAAKYAEPLWRRISDGQSAATRRVTGGAEPTNPACMAHPESALPADASSSDPCQGPFATQDSAGYGTWNGGEPDADFIPRLSADGYTVAFLATAPLVKNGGGAFGLGGSGLPSDAYVSDMHEGLTRSAALRQLTEFASGDSSHIATNAWIVDLGISPDGSQVAFATKRTVFPLGSPAYVSAPAASPGLVELFDVDLSNDTLTRVTHGYEGGETEHPHEELGSEDPYPRPEDGVLSPSFSAGGVLLAFSSTASNLVYGDGNTPPGIAAEGDRDGSDAFAVKRTIFETTPTPQAISPAPPNPSLTRAWSFGASAVSLANGNVELYVQLPGAGKLSARAGSSVRITVHPRAKRHHRGKARTVVVQRTIASATHSEAPGETGLVTAVLPLAAVYRSQAEQKNGLSGSVLLTFSAPGHPELRTSIAVTFKRHAAMKRPAPSKSKHAKKGARR
jgi:hypothetical protein